MPHTVKQWQNTSAGGTKINAAALIDLEQRLGAYTDTAVGRRAIGDRTDPIPRLRERNDFPNPRVASANGYAGSFTAGVTTTSSGVIADTDFNEPYETTGGGFRAIGTVNAALQAVAVTAGEPIASSAYAAVNNTFGVGPVFARARVKLTQGASGGGNSGGNTVNLYVIQYDGTNTRYHIVATRENVAVGEIVELEGFDNEMSNSTRSAIQVTAFPTTYSAAQVMELRIGRVQIVNNPDTECARYVSGGVDEGAWTGTADNSPSYAYLAKSKSSYGDDFWLGTNNYASAYDRAHSATLNDEEHARVLADMGGNVDRIPINFTATTPDGFVYWPSTNTIPDFTASTFRYKKLLDGYRAEGKKVLCIIGAVPSWMSNNGPFNGSVGYSMIWDINPTYRTRYYNAINSLISTYPDVIVGLEFCNEPNYSAVWGSYPTATPSPATYMGELTPFYTAIKAANPQVIVLNGAPGDFWTTSGNDIGLRPWIEGCYTNNLKTSCDGQAIHVYPPLNGTNDNAAALGLDAQGYPIGGSPGWNADLNGWRKLQKAQSDTARPLYLTETGINTGYGGTNTERAQAQVHMLTLGLAKRNGWLKAWMNNGAITNYDVIATQAGWTPIEQKTVRKRLAYYAQKNGRLPENDWRPITLINGWTPVATLIQPRYRYLPDGSIQFQGSLSYAGTPGNVIFLKMPEGREPGPDLYFGGFGYNGTTMSTVLFRYLFGVGMYAAIGQQTNQMHFDYTYTPVG